MRPRALVGDRYELELPLGEGTFGAVWRARDLRLAGRTVAVKFLKAEFLDNPDVLQRFTREADALAAVQSPRVVAVLDRGLWEGRHYLVLEHLEGVTLGRWLEPHREARRSPPVAAVQALLDQVCEGVAAAHAVRVPGPVVHRDLKPENVLLRDDGAGGQQVKVLDFGVAQLGARSVTLTGDRLGTVVYMPPEQGSGRAAEVGPWSDVFSLGVVLWELLTLDPIGPGDQPWWVLALQGVDPRGALLARRPELPPALGEVLGRALQATPQARFLDAGALRAALRAAWGAGAASGALATAPTMLATAPPGLASAPTVTPWGAPAAPPSGPWGAPAGTVAWTNAPPSGAGAAPAARTPRRHTLVVAAVAVPALLLLGLVCVAGASRTRAGATVEATTDAAPDAAPDACAEPVNATWEVLRGTLARGDPCGVWEATSDGAPGGSIGHYQLRRRVGSRVELSVRVRRLTADHHRPMEVYFRGGAFGVTDQGQWYLYEAEDHWTGWRRGASIVAGENLLTVHQERARVTALVNGQVVGAFTLRQDPGTGPVAMFFKGDGGLSRFTFRDFTVSELP
ncbi:MAG: serine/threonine protein kinase [Deltaproteobacteria bacterium]|nr:serine/threonine protein kinase [Deltaproteobacteria bacterium]